MVNKVTLIGNVGAAPEIISFDNGNRIATLPLATTKRWKDKNTGEKKEKSTWHTIQFSGPLVAIVEQYVQKGQRLHIEGSIDNYTYQKDNETRYATRIICSEMNMLSSKNETGAHQPDSPQSNQPTQSTGDDDDLPF